MDTFIMSIYGGPGPQTPLDLAALGDIYIVAPIESALSSAEDFERSEDRGFGGLASP